MKRAFDFGVALGGLVILSPLLAAAAGLVKLSSPGPAIYRGVRVGRDGRTFEILKLRTMVLGADTQGPAVTSAADARVTPIGRFLRRTKFDEVPQLVNVLRGEMSLVGPRPEHPEFVKHYSDDQRRVLAVRPGVTSPAALAYMSEEEKLAGDDPAAEYVSTIMPHKLALDLDYVRTATFAGDLRIIGRTLARVIVRR
jgi:lipopolysaccharide/colanic/teichoic acid biosynthesis glycosyltransferase